MMKITEALRQFKENVAGGTSEPPDQYPEWYTGGWATHRRDLLTCWAIAKDGIKRDTDKARLIDLKLEQALASFDQGRREPGRSLMVEIYNVLNLNTLR